MSYLKGLGNSVQSQGGFKKWPISGVDPLAVISGWNALDGSMGPGGHVRSLDMVMGDLPGAHWVQNDRLRGSFSA